MADIKTILISVTASVGVQVAYFLMIRAPYDLKIKRSELRKQRASRDSHAHHAEATNKYLGEAEDCVHEWLEWMSEYVMDGTIDEDRLLASFRKQCQLHGRLLGALTDDTTDYYHLVCLDYIRLLENGKDLAERILSGEELKIGVRHARYIQLAGLYSSVNSRWRALDTSAMKVNCDILHEVTVLEADVQMLVSKMILAASGTAVLLVWWGIRGFKWLN